MNPQRNPYVDPTRRHPLHEEEILAIEKVQEQYPELGPWNLSMILSREHKVHVSPMSIYRVLFPEKYRSNVIEEEEGIRFYEKRRPHAMYHADTMDVELPNGNKVYQISIEDDCSRGYMGMDVFKHKHSYFTILMLLKACQDWSKPRLFHHDNGGEYENGAMTRLLGMLGITDVPTKVENPKGNGKKERAHRQDRKYLYEKYKFEEIDSIRKAIPDYLEFRNEKKGHWSLYGQPPSSILKNAKVDPLTNEELDYVIKNLYFKRVERKVKQNVKVKFEGKWYHVGKRLAGEWVEVRITLRGLETWFEGEPLKRWRYWKCVLGIDVDCVLKEYLGYVIVL